MEHAVGDATYERAVKLGLPCVYYQLNEKEGTGQIHDHSGYALHAKAVGELTSAPGLAGDAVAFAGILQLIHFFCSFNYHNSFI